jgi:protein SCO1
MNRIASRLRILFFIFPSIICAGCQPPVPGQTSSAPGGATTPKSDEVKAYKLTGKVIKIIPEDGDVVLDHEAIPNYMPKMRMPFPVKDRAALADLHPGDEVEGTLRVGSKSSELADIKVIKRAGEEGLKVDVSAGTARVELKHAVLEPGQPVPDFAVTTQEGKTLHLSDLRGHVVVLTFIYTRCPLPDFCPLIDRKFAELASKVGAVASRAEQVRLLSVSFDSAHDTPEVLRLHAERQGAQPPLWTFAVASNDELAKVAPALGLVYWPDTNEIGHNLVTAIIDPAGRLARLERGRKWEPIDFLKTINGLLPRSRQ